MFGSSAKKPSRPALLPEDKFWIEESFKWLVQIFGTGSLNREQPFLIPDIKTFPYTNYKDPLQIRQLLEQLCGYMQLNPDEIVFSFFDDFKSLQWTTSIPFDGYRDTFAFFSEEETKEGKRMELHIARSRLEHPELLVTTLVHELAQIRLVGGGYLPEDHTSRNDLADLACIFFGFGIFMANHVITRDNKWISRAVYLSPEMIGYANALLCYITEHDAKVYLALFNDNTRSFFKNDHAYLTATQDTLFSIAYLVREEKLAASDIEIDLHFKNRDFEAVLRCGAEQLALIPEDTIALNAIGYALLHQKKYEDAIAVFTRAIAKDALWDYPYNNRGYCKLQLNDLDGALADIQYSAGMNPGNPYSQRNLGAYYLEIKEVEHALICFDNAAEALPDIELIHFYRSKAHEQLGNMEQAQYYREQSRLLHEYNYSTLE